MPEVVLCTNQRVSGEADSGEEQTD